MEFQTAEELKMRVMPALKMKEERLKKDGFHVNADEIWFYLKQNKWCKDNNLTLNEIVNDILKLNGSVFGK